MPTKLSKKFSLNIPIIENKMINHRLESTTTGAIKISGTGYYFPHEDHPDFLFDYDVDNIQYSNMEEPPVQSDNIISLLKYIGFLTIKTISRLHEPTIETVERLFAEEVALQGTFINSENTEYHV